MGQYQGLQLKYVTPIFTLPYPVLWKRNLLLCTYTVLKEKPRDVILQINTVTIRIFVKGLKNANSLATQIYEKGPQTLADAISEVANVMKTGANIVDPDHNHIIEDTTAKVTITHTEAILGHTILTADDITGVIHDSHTQTLIYTILTMTLHIEGHLHTGAHQLIHKIAADHALDQPTGQLRKPCIRIHHIPEDPKVICTLKEIQESQ